MRCQPRLVTNKHRWNCSFNFNEIFWEIYIWIKNNLHFLWAKNYCIQMERGLGESKVISDLVNLKDKADSFFIKSANLNNNSFVQFKRHHNVDLFLNIIDYYVYTYCERNKKSASFYLPPVTPCIWEQIKLKRAAGDYWITNMTFMCLPFVLPNNTHASNHSGLHWYCRRRSTIRKYSTYEYGLISSFTLQLWKCDPEVICSSHKAAQTNIIAFARQTYIVTAESASAIYRVCIKNRFTWSIHFN